MVSVPAVVGLDLQDAVDHTVCAGLRVGLHPQDPSAVGIVLAQVPAAGAEVPSGTTVALSVRST
jgi:beta-lactam-binding protein with PASTA domain